MLGKWRFDAQNGYRGEDSLCGNWRLNTQRVLAMSEANEGEFRKFESPTIRPGFHLIRVARRVTVAQQSLPIRVKNSVGAAGDLFLRSSPFISYFPILLTTKNARDYNYYRYNRA